MDTKELVERLRGGRHWITNDDLVASADALERAESELTTLRARVAKMEEALKRISRPHDCGCVPCVGQCRSQESLEIANEGMRETARDALTEEPKP